MVERATEDEYSSNWPSVATKPSGTFERAGGKLISFTPAMMPPRLRLDNPIIRRIIEAERALADLNALGSRLVNPEMITKSYITREAAESSRISGIPATAEDLMRHEAANHTAASIMAEMRIQESLNCRDAILYCIGKIKDGADIDVDLIRETHSVLMKGTNAKGAGKLRRTQKFNPSDGTPVGDDIVVPTASKHVRELLQDLLKYASGAGEVSRLVQCAFIQYQFEIISPFNTGNGRMARLLALAYLYKWGLISGSFLYLSSYYERRRTHYQQKMEGIRMRSRWREWLLFFLDAVITQSRESVVAIENLSALRIRYKSRLKNPNALTLVDTLLSNPYITISGASAALNIGYTAAKNAVGDLMTHSVLDRADMALRNRLFRASAIVDAQRGQSQWGPESA
ncbi:MAG: Fic family protein [Nitrosopumilaceae archaeon]|nr:Fic family protein [Nitrosopumilaceae archaeon]